MALLVLVGMILLFVDKNGNLLFAIFAEEVLRKAWRTREERLVIARVYLAILLRGEISKNGDFTGIDLREMIVERVEVERRALRDHRLCQWEKRRPSSCCFFSHTRTWNGVAYVSIGGQDANRRLGTFVHYGVRTDRL